MNISYQFYHEATLPDLQRLWAESTDWGEHTLRNLHEWFMAAPCGKPRILVAVDEDTDEIVGQFRFMPSIVSVNGREVRAVRPFGTIVSKKMRDAIRSPNQSEQPAIAMYLRGVKELQAMGERLIYMVPDPRWVRMFELTPFFQCGSFPLWSLPLPLPAPMPLGEGYTASRLVSWDERVDRLWEKCAQLHGCLVVRNARTLSWKIANAKYEVTTVERDGELVGLAASRAKGDRQWLICDMLFADTGDDLRATLAAAANVAHEQALEANADKPIIKVSVLVTPNMETVAASLNFKRDAYDFPIVVHTLDSSISLGDVAPSQWYVSAND